ncbi:protein ALP1-like [Rosa chinensis]|uniref:protein ALP1-like n=1 Tax=Rosa chinensis TaxID=74649 RepID=UPI000D0886B2|nr:protein ALP1-like [Rosa chinensis]
MVDCLDCMHWQWKNCPTGWAGQYTSYRGKPTIILEAVTSYDTWIWHVFFGLPGSLNDINVLECSPLFNDVCTGETPKVNYQVHNRHYRQCYYLVDGRYPKWGSFVQAIRNPRSPQTQHFTRMQEAYRKDMERAFGILQARWAIIRGPTRGWSKENLQYIMTTCIILHNVIVEDEHDEDAA